MQVKNLIRAIAPLRTNTFLFHHKIYMKRFDSVERSATLLTSIMEQQVYSIKKMNARMDEQLKALNRIDAAISELERKTDEYQQELLALKTGREASEIK